MVLVWNRELVTNVLRSKKLIELLAGDFSSVIGVYGHDCVLGVLLKVIDPFDEFGWSISLRL
jgi:hypothetical protein